MFYRSKTLILLIAVCFASFSGCDKTKMTPVVADQPSPALGGGGDDCKFGTQLSFPADVTTDPNDDESFAPDFAVKLETGTYNSDDCLCSVNAYILEFQDIPIGTEMHVTSVNGDTVPSFIVQGPGNMPGITGDILQIVGFEELPGPVATVYIDIDGPHLPLMQAGGLCVIENYGSGYPISGVQTMPIIELIPYTPPAQGFYNKYFIPAAIGSPI